jgi:hypothetical protein
LDSLCAHIRVNIHYGYHRQLIEKVEFALSVGCFIDKSYVPTEDAIQQSLGSALHLWISLVDILCRRTDQKLRYLYGRKYGWAKQFRIKGKPIVALFPNEGYFVALIILNQDQLLAASQLRLHKNAIGAMDAANLYREGKWLFVRVQKPNDLKDIEALLRLKEL